ncbi:ER lumen protein-retaining receptor B [Linum grandiflorum]
MGSKTSAVNRRSPVKAVAGWVGRQSTRVKVIAGVAMGLLTLVGLKLWVNPHQYFAASETIHAAGILVLAYKLITQKTCSGLSLRSQALTALFLAVRMSCSVFMEADIHTVLDLASLLSTVWVIYMMKFKLKSSYIKELDNMPLYYLVIPCFLLALMVKPYTSYGIMSQVLWAFCTYLEAISVLPQLRMMQNAKMIEPFTSHYVFALGIARFFACAHWIIAVIETRGAYLYIMGSGYLWLAVAFIAEMVQTFILADFCYYYVKSFVAGQLVMRMPV